MRGRLPLLIQEVVTRHLVRMELDGAGWTMEYGVWSLECSVPIFGLRLRRRDPLPSGSNAHAFHRTPGRPVPAEKPPWIPYRGIHRALTLDSGDMLHSDVMISIQLGPIVPSGPTEN